MRRACLECRRPYEALTAKSRFCSGACRAAASRTRRAEAASAPLGRAATLLEEAQAALQEAPAAIGGQAKGGAH